MPKNQQIFTLLLFGNIFLFLNGCSESTIREETGFYPLKIIIQDFDGDTLRVNLNEEVIIDGAVNSSEDSTQDSLIIDRIYPVDPGVIMVSARYSNTNYELDINLSDDCNQIYISPLQESLIEFENSCVIMID